MLRRKLILNLGPMVILLLLTAVVAIILLQGVLRRMDEHRAYRVDDDINALATTVHDIEVRLYELRRDENLPLDPLIMAVDRAQMLVDRIGQYPLRDEPNGGPNFLAIRDGLPRFRRHVSALATSQDRPLAMRNHDQTLQDAAVMREHIGPLSQSIHEMSHREQDALYAQFRWVVLGLSIVFLVVINVSVVLLLRLGRMVLRPIDALVEATRQLSGVNLDYRVKLDGVDDEFAQLALAYNNLAERLQANEQRKLETLGQVALAMNHELNNVISIISLQLRLVGRQAPGNVTLESSLKQIQASLARMTEAVQMLKNVRRIVLTDYVSGLKMLDLRRSAEEANQSSPTESAEAAKV